MGDVLALGGTDEYFSTSRTAGALISAGARALLMPSRLLPWIAKPPRRREPLVDPLEAALEAYAEAAGFAMPGPDLFDFARHSAPNDVIPFPASRY